MITRPGYVDCDRAAFVVVTLRRFDRVSLRIERLRLNIFGLLKVSVGVLMVAMHGCDLRKIPNTDRYDYGLLPPRFFNQVLDAFVAWHRVGKRRLTPRE
jgi:hypothetical protein